MGGIVSMITRLFTNLPLALQIGVACGAAVFGLYSWRFMVSAPKSLEFSDRGVSVVFRDGRTDQAAWAEISHASFASVFGLRWKFRMANSTLLLRGDGLAVMDWFRISRLILETLAARGIEVSTDLGGGKFLFELGGDDYSP